MRQNNANDLDMKVNPSRLKPLFKTNMWRHLMAMTLDWTMIIITAYFTLQYFNPITYVLAVIIIGARQHALAILMHDASHFRFLKNKKWNDWVTNIFTMYPLFTSIEVYRENHMRHHRHLNSEHDPDWVAKLGKRDFTFPKTKTDFLRTIFSYFILYKGISDAIWFLKRFGGKKGKAKEQPVQPKFRKLGFYILLAAGLSFFGGWKVFLLFWVVPYLSTFFMFQYIRSVAEHFGELAYDDLLTSTRTVKPNLIERFIIAPHNVGYHLEHHLYPGVPFYHLPKLHYLLMEDQDYNGAAHITRGYMSGLLQELGSVK